MQKTTKTYYEKIFCYSEKIQKLYKKLYELDILGKKDSEMYKETVDNIKLLTSIEDNEYKKMFLDYQTVIEFNDTYMEKFYDLLEGNNTIDLIFQNESLMPLQRIDTKFNKRLAMYEDLDKFLETDSDYDYSLSASEPNYLIFNLYVDSQHYKNTINLLNRKLKEYEYYDNRYKLLAKYYYGLTYMEDTIERMFLNNKIEKINHFSEFIENLPESKIKSNYNQILLETSIIKVSCILQELIFDEFPKQEDYQKEGIQDLYDIELENAILCSPQKALNILEPAVYENIEKIYYFAETSTIPKNKAFEKVKTIIDKTKRND